jgi:hypothetical protein
MLPEPIQHHVLARCDKRCLESHRDQTENNRPASRINRRVVASLEYLSSHDAGNVGAHHVEGQGDRSSGVRAAVDCEPAVMESICDYVSTHKTTSANWKMTYANL